jgi:methionine sulfoxide reductase heme-binding subunit
MLRFRKLRQRNGSRQVHGITSSTALWYASRATGVVALLLLTAAALLGLLVSRQGRLPRLPGFGATSLHRSLSLLAVAFVAVHVATAIADPFVTIGIAASVIPFVSPYEPFWLGLGAVSLDIMLALIVTSLLRARIGRRTWRAVHWLAYLSWPAAFAHSIGSSTDLQRGWLLDLAIGCAVAVAAGLTWRVAGSLREAGPARRVAQVLAAVTPARGGQHVHEDNQPQDPQRLRSGPELSSGHRLGAR